jgi:crotonobetaine/carnitine-CoA ligase
MHQILDDQAGRDGGKIFARHGDQTLTYSGLANASRRLACSFLQELGVRRGDKVAVMLPNCLDFLVVQFAISRAGAVMVPVNLLAQEGLLAHFLTQSDANVLVLSPDHVPAIAAVIGALENLQQIVLTEATDTTGLAGAVTVHALKDLLACKGDGRLPEISHTDDVDIFYTSGTTGVSKGVVLSHNHHYVFGSTIAQAGRLGPEDVIFITLPLYHGAGSYMSIMPALVSGASIALADRFSASRWLNEVRAVGATATWGVSSIAPILMKQPEKPDDADNPLKVYFCIGIPSDTLEKFEQRFGVKVIDNYGSTEAGHLAYSAWDERRPGAVGPINTDWFEVRIVDENDDEVPVGEIGECVSRSKYPFTQMSEYYRMPQETLQLMRNRWLHSGDLCKVDADGWLYFMGRGKDTIRRRGENISCYELENLLTGYGIITECAAVPVPSELGEDEIKLVLALSQPAEPADAFAICTAKLPKYMHPRYLEIVEAIPKLGNEKIDKQRLKVEGLNSRTWDAETQALLQRSK